MRAVVVIDAAVTFAHLRALLIEHAQKVEPFPLAHVLREPDIDLIRRRWQHFVPVRLGALVVRVGEVCRAIHERGPGHCQKNDDSHTDYPLNRSHC